MSFSLSGGEKIECKMCIRDRDRADFIASFNEYDLLIIDDLGVERSTEYAMEQMLSLIHI